MLMVMSIVMGMEMAIAMAEAMAMADGYGDVISDGNGIGGAQLLSHHSSVGSSGQ